MHLDGLGLSLGSPNGGQLKKLDSESLTLQHYSFNDFWHFFHFEHFLGIFELVQASGWMVGADTIPRPYNHTAIKI